MTFNIGDTVKTKDGVGQIIDKMYSEREIKFFYHVRLEGELFKRVKVYAGEEITSYKDEPKEEYTVETEILENVVVVKILKSEKDSSIREEVVRGHGHIIHEGDIGIVQALSYALKKAYEKINGGSF
jgi:hypothetical protein